MPDREPRRWYEMVRAEAGDAATIRIFGDIGESWWGDSVSATSFADELDALGRNVRSIELRINSPGGDMFDGVAIYNTLRNHSARKTVYVDGLAASAASVIAMAGDEIVMGTGTQRRHGVHLRGPRRWCRSHVAGSHAGRDLVQRSGGRRRRAGGPRCAARK
jgi:ATP-dependent protease ClpP protease subunit